MRWDELRVDAEQGRSLPGYRDPAVVRTFDAPEALDTRFYEVRAKSALNRVPERSRMPFRWTINPYRGCTHACVYCLAGDTPILMADGRTKPLEAVRVGDEIYGTVRRGAFRRYAVTRVLAHWRTVKPAYRVTLDDGTELVASGDHRFLTRRGWKYVAGGARRRHLTPRDELLGTGPLAHAPSVTSDYRRGYLCGAIGGSVSHQDDVSDLEAVQRVRDYLVVAGAGTRELEFAEAAGSRRMAAVAATAQTEDLVEWPRSPGDDWCRGFLAGVFDADGGHDRSVLRIASSDPVTIDWLSFALRRLAFDHAVDRRPDGDANGVRLRGGQRALVRFLRTTDPAVTRKRSLAGMALRPSSTARVASVDALSVDLPMFDITTGTGDFIADGVVSHNCFARPTHKYLDMDAGRDFEREIVVKVNVPELLRTELARPSWTREHVALGTNTDPYQWVEGRYKLMPGIWEAMRDFANPASVLTKSPLVLRDLPLLKELAARASFSANLSVPTLDERAWRATEPHTPNPRARLEAVAELNRAGIPTGILVAPLMPGINDSPEQVERILDLASEAGAVHVSGIALHLRGEVRGIFFDWLRSKRPDLVPHYESLYQRGAYAPPAERKRLSALVAGWDGPPGRYMRDYSRGGDEPTETEPQAAALQPSLF